MACRTIAAAERFARQAIDVIHDGAHTGLVRIGAVHVGTATVAILLVEVVGPGLRVRVLDLVRRRHVSDAICVIVGHVTRDDRNEVRARSAHDRLMVVVAHGIVFRERLEVGGVTGAHVIETHGDAALIGVGRRHRRIVLGTDADRFGDPGKQVIPALVVLLPHLEKAVYGISHVCVIAHVFRDLEGAIREVRREARVGHARCLAGGIGRVRLRQGGIGAGLRGVQHVEVRVAGLLLRSLGKVGPRAAIGIDDALRKQISDRLAAGRTVTAVHVVERVVLTHDHDDVLNRGKRVLAAMVLRNLFGGIDDRNMTNDSHAQRYQRQPG